MRERMRRKLMSIEKGVRTILKEDPRARNNDLWLIIEFWRRQGHKIFIPYEAIENGSLAIPESITRARRKIQNEEGLFLPTDPEVAKARGIKEEVMREYYSKRRRW